MSLTFDFFLYCVYFLFCLHVCTCCLRDECESLHKTKGVEMKNCQYDIQKDMPVPRDRNEI